MDHRADNLGHSERAGEPEPLVRLGPRIVESRNARGWNQGELARRAGLRSARLSKLERGVALPRLPELVKLAKALGADLNGLILGVPSAGSASLETIRELETLASPEEAASLGRLLQVLLLGFRVAAGEPVRGRRR